jgi:3-oxoacyl-[acyl-carrier-protein] synthase II
MNRRVVVTGMAGLCPLGKTWEEVRDALKGLRSGVTRQDGWDGLEGLQTRLAAAVPDFQAPPHWGRQKIRAMGRVAMLAARATELAIEDAKLTGHPALTDGSTGVAYGSTSGSPAAIEDYYHRLDVNRSLKGLSPNTYIQLMSHTCAANLAQFFTLRGRVIPTCSACTSGSQGIGYAYEAIKSGKQKLMVAGGAEELHISAAVVFDVLFATSTQPGEKPKSPRPFDKDRDGLVVGEGAATLILEDMGHAAARGAKWYAEVVGFGTNSDGTHITNPDTNGMEKAMRLALEDAGMKPEQVGYVNAHGTATELGDIAESQATSRVFGEKMPFSSLKSYMGHTLGACGALEAWISIRMMEEGWFAPTLHLETVDDRCGRLDYIRGAARELKTDCVMSNNFAFGGVNTSLLLRRPS